MERFIGYYVRQRRRERNLTQSELAHGMCSKSYVSAVENGKLHPSLEALTHFAVRLGEPGDYFLTLAHQIQQQEPRSVPEALQESAILSILAQEKMVLLDTLLDQSAQSDCQVPEAFFTLSAEALAALPSQNQAHYALFQGRMFQGKADYPAAIPALERALALEEHPAHVVSLLDALGMCYLHVQQPQVALSYARCAQPGMAGR